MVKIAQKNSFVLNPLGSPRQTGAPVHAMHLASELLARLNIGGQVNESMCTIAYRTVTDRISVRNQLVDRMSDEPIHGCRIGCHGWPYGKFAALAIGQLEGVPWRAELLELKGKGGRDGYHISILKQDGSRYDGLLTDHSTIDKGPVVRLAIAHKNKGHMSVLVIHHYGVDLHVISGQAWVWECDVVLDRILITANSDGLVWVDEKATWWRISSSSNALPARRGQVGRRRRPQDR